MAYTKYSLTPSSNTAAPPDGAPEGMLPSAVNDTMRDMMAQIRDCGDGIRDGTYTMTTPKITGGTITGVTFTSIVVTGGSITGTTVTSNTFSSSGATITGGTINSTAIGGTTTAAGKFTTLEATGVTTVQAGTAALPAITTTGDTNTGIYFPAADTIAFTEGGVETARFDSSGQFLVGTTTALAQTTIYKAGSGLQVSSPQLTLQNAVVDGGSGDGAGINFANATGAVANIGSSGDGVFFFSSRASTGAGWSERMRIDSNGNLIMAASAGYLQLPTNQTMRVPSTGGIGYVGNINSATVFQIAYNSTSAGVQLSSGATSWGTFSDSRLKNITGTYTNALNDIAQIQAVKFTWKSDKDNKPQVGVIAQSVQNVVPESVDSTTIEMDGTEEYLTVRYTELIPLMIAAIQELNAKVDAQAVRIAELEGAK